MQHNTPLQSVKTIWRSLWDKKYTLLDLTNCRTPCAKNKSLNDEPLTSRSSVAWNNYPCKAVEFISQSPIQPNSVNIGIRAKPESGRKIMINLAVLSRSTYFDRTHYTWGSSGLLFFYGLKQFVVDFAPSSEIMCITPDIQLSQFPANLLHYSLKFTQLRPSCSHYHSLKCVFF